MSTFADTFYWIALTNLQDLAHEKAKSLTLSAAPGTLCTTEEVLTEYLNYFAAWGSNFRRKVSRNVQTDSAKSVKPPVRWAGPEKQDGARSCPPRVARRALANAVTSGDGPSTWIPAASGPPSAPAGVPAGAYRVRRCR